MEKSKLMLHVEGDAVDAMRVDRALKEVNTINRIVHISDCKKALDYLDDVKAESPSIILLSLDMPGMQGIDFLEIIKQDECLNLIPVVALTMSDDEEIKSKAFSLNVADYIIKPDDDQQFVDVIKKIDSYWSLCELTDGG